MVKKILVVDDEPDILTSLRMLLTKEGYSVQTAGSGMEALSVLKKKKFDLVLLDVLMPQMSGREVLQKIRADSKIKNQKVAFLTVVQLSQIGQELVKKLKPVAYFQKPIENLEYFKLKIKELL